MYLCTMFKKLILSLLAFAQLALSKAHSPTWVDDIACIIISHCGSCHNPNGIAPFSLVTYDDVYANRFSLVNSIKLKRMPPFSPVEGVQEYMHENRLSQHEIDDIEDWVNNLAPFGDVSKTPPVPVYSAAGQIANPDLEIKIPNYVVNTSDDLYKWFIIPTGVDKPKFIQSIEVIPSDRTLTHHALVFHGTDSNTNVAQANMITGYVPGQGVFEFPTGTGNYLPPNSYIILQVHYPGGVVNKIDSSRIRIKFAPGLVRNLATLPALEHNSTLTNGALIIPANTVKTFYNKLTVNSDYTIFGLSPHMHLLGKSIKSGLIKPNGDTTWLIDIPKWDFEWQGYYQFKKPIVVAKGSTLIGEATYDNTTANSNNPNTPPALVHLGEGTDDEMFLIYFNFTGYLAGDENLVYSTDTHFTHYHNCNGPILSNKPINQLKLNVYPNPANNIIHVQAFVSTQMMYVINSQGWVVWHGLASQIATDKWPAGLYTLVLQAEDKFGFEKIVIE